jgi:predicted dehydrogenase
MSPRIGLIGCGRWGRNILRDLRLCGAEIQVASPSADDRAAALAAGASNACADLDELPPVNGYVVATPSATHAAVIERLLPSGRPIFVEKPMTVTVESAARLVRVGSDRLYVMQKWRYHPAIERIRQEIASGWLGHLRAIRIQRWGWGNPHGDVNALWILLPHDLSIVMHWLGHLPPLHSVSRTVPGPIDAGLIARLGDGDPLVTIDTSTAAPQHRRSFLVIGSAGSVELPDADHKEILVRRGSPGAANAARETIPVDQEMPLLLEIRAFLNHLSGGPPPMSSAREGLIIVERTAEIEAAANAAGFA